MGRKRAIICFETEERFESVTDAANAIGAAWPLVSSALKRHGHVEDFTSITLTKRNRTIRFSTERFIRTQDQSSALRRTNVLKVKQGQQKRLAYRERLFMRH